jgi:maleylpyruvate isomerase
MILYDYFRSSAAYRVRIALNLKGVEYEKAPVNLLDGEQLGEDYRKRNPQRLVPMVETAHGLLTQSLAIIEYLDEIHPDPPLLSDESWLRAEQRAMAQVIACDVHPLNNLRVLKYLRDTMQQSEQDVRMWISHWITVGFETLEQHATTTPFLGGDRPQLPDIVLVPQMYNARRYEVPLDAFPKLVAITERCNILDPFVHAAPNPGA